MRRWCLEGLRKAAAMGKGHASYSWRRGSRLMTVASRENVAFSRLGTWVRAGRAGTGTMTAPFVATTGGYADSVDGGVKSRTAPGEKGRRLRLTQRPPQRVVTSLPKGVRERWSSEGGSSMSMERNLRLLMVRR